MYVRVLADFCGRYVSRESGATAGFDPDKPYKVHKIESYSESGAGFVVLVNDQREIWWVENRHVRVTSEEDFPREASPIGLPIRVPQSGPYTA